MLNFKRSVLAYEKGNDVMELTNQIEREKAIKLGYATYNPCMHYLTDMKKSMLLLKMLLHKEAIFNVFIESSEDGIAITLKYKGRSASPYINSLVHKPEGRGQFHQISSKNNEYVINTSEGMVRNSENINWGKPADKEFDMQHISTNNKQLTVSLKLPNEHFITFAYTPHINIGKEENGSIDIKYHGLEWTEISALDPDTTYEEVKIKSNGHYEYKY